MNRTELLERYHEAEATLEPATPEQIARVAGFVGRFLQDIVVEPTGESFASWRLANGIVVNVRADMTLRFQKDDTGELNFSVFGYEISFRRYLEPSKPESEQSQFVELSYIFEMPTPNSLSGGFVCRSYDVVDIDQEYLFNPAHAQMSSEEFGQSLEDSAQQFMDSLASIENISKADVTMLMDAMRQMADYKQDPFVLLGSDLLKGEIATPDDLKKLTQLIEAAASQGFVGYGRYRIIELPLDPSYKAELSAFQDESEKGPNAGSIDLGDFPAWIISLVFKQANNPVTEEFRLKMELSGTVESHYLIQIPNSSERFRLMEENPEAYELYKQIGIDRLHVKAVKKSLGLYGATAAEVRWFEEIIELAENQS